MPPEDGGGGREGGRKEDGEVTAAGHAVDRAAKTGSRKRRNEGQAAKRFREGRGAPRDTSQEAAAAAAVGGSDCF